MKKNKLFIYLDQPAGNQQLEKVFPKKMQLRNYKIEYISTQKINFSKKQINEYYKRTPKKDVPNFIKNLSNLTEFENFLKKLNKKDLIFIRERSVTADKRKNFDLYLFKKYNIRTIFLDYYPWIECNFKKEFFINFMRLTWRYYNFFIGNLFKIDYSPHYIIGSGQYNKLRNLNQKKTKYIDAPSLWIDFKKKIKNKRDLIIYVDENIFYSRDQFLFGNYKNHKKVSDTKLFLINLLNFFEIIEKKFNKKVIISCSKKHIYSKNLFGNRKIIYGKTLQLISESKLVLGHRGDSLYQALYSKTPVLLLKSKFFDLKKNTYINSRSINHFNKKSYFIEDYLKNKVDLDFTIDKNFYNSIFKNYFLSPGTKKENFSNKIETELNKI
jgi:hypothetical protein